MKPSTNVIILAAGLGTRMKSRRAKVLHRAGGLTLIEHVVRTATAIAAPENITVVVGHQAEEVKKVLADTPVRFAMQTEQKGTGHAVMICADALHEESGYTVIIYGDGPLLSASTLARLVETEQSSSTAATLITTVLQDPRGYGRVVLDDRGTVLSIVEEKAATDEQRKVKLVNSGIYCFRTDLLRKHIAEIEPNPRSGEYYLTDMPEICARHGHAVGAMEVADSTELLGINTRAELAEVDALLRSRKTRELMLAGVTIEKPETVTVDVDVSAGMDSEIGPFAQLLGNTRIGENCRIGACSIVQNSILEDGVVVEPFTVINRSRVAAAANIGPFARLRFDNEVGPSAHIGNFVELKNTRMGAGAKSNHLAYLGDSDIGARVNVGAGTITCNYDGVRKHRTQIGEGAFIGSNSTLVAPIEIGSDSYVGAGSVITDPVPPGALALGRGRQVVKEGWVEERKKQ